MKINYNERHFRSVANSGAGDVDLDTLFHYRHTEMSSGRPIKVVASLSVR